MKVRSHNVTRRGAAGETLIDTVPTVARRGVFYVHAITGWWAITHGPTGLRVEGRPSEAWAVDLARHLAAHVGATTGGPHVWGVGTDALREAVRGALATYRSGYHARSGR